METVEIEITDKKAMKLLLDMEEMHLIKVVKKKTGISSLRKMIKNPMSNEQIDEQLKALRNEWETDI